MLAQLIKSVCYLFDSIEQQFDCDGQVQIQFNETFTLIGHSYAGKHLGGNILHMFHMPGHHFHVVHICIYMLYHLSPVL